MIERRRDEQKREIEVLVFGIAASSTILAFDFRRSEESRPQIITLPFEQKLDMFMTIEEANIQQGKKNDEGKLRMDLIPPEAIEALAAVLTFGATKYEDRNWEKGIDRERLFAACQRHLWATWKGERLDPESNLPHIYHALTNLAMWIALDERSKKSDPYGAFTE